MLAAADQLPGVRQQLLYPLRQRGEADAAHDLIHPQ